MTTPQLRLRRVDRWIGQEGAGLVPLPWDAAALLEHRLRVRSRAAMVSARLLLLAFAAYLAATGTLQFRPGDVDDPSARWWALWVVLFAIAITTRQVRVVRGERALAAELTRRVADDRSSSLRAGLGRSRFAQLCIAVGAPAVVLVALVVLGGTPVLVVAYALAMCAALGCTAAAVRQTLAEPRIAIDAASLEIDRRVRSRDVAASCYPSVVLVASTVVPIDLLGFGGQSLGLAAAIFPAGVFLVFAVLEVAGRRESALAVGARP